jgi:hypothetical protein
MFQKKLRLGIIRPTFGRHRVGREEEGRVSEKWCKDDDERAGVNKLGDTGARTTMGWCIHLNVPMPNGVSDCTTRLHQAPIDIFQCTKYQSTLSASFSNFRSDCTKHQTTSRPPELPANLGVLHDQPLIDWIALTLIPIFTSPA